MSQDHAAPPVRVLVIDDTVVYRKLVGEVLSTIPGVEVVGVAGNGKIGLAKIGHLKPDLVTLDIEMPVMTGIEMLEVVQQAGLEVGVLVLSTLTRRGGALTLQAMELGAFDYITKPEGGSLQESAKFLRGEL